MKVKLEDVCERESSNLKQSDVIDKQGDYPVFGASGHIGNVDFYHQESSYVAVVKDGAGIGRTALYPAKSSVIGTMQYLLPKKNVLPEYLCYVVKYMHLEKYFSGATIPHIYFKEYKSEEFNLDSLDKQVKIVSILGKIEKVIQSRQKELKLLDELIKARFVEMFGDPINNSKGLETTDFVNVVKLQRGFDLPVQDRVQDGDIPVFGSNGALDSHNEAKVIGGGVITGRSGSIGKVYYTEEDYWPLNTSLFSADLHGNNIVYLAYLLELFDLSRFADGTGVPTLNRNNVHNKQIISVPVKQQKEFSAFVKQVDKLKVAVQKTLDETQLLFDSLMQKYFG